MDRDLDRIIKLRNRIAHHEPIGPVPDVLATVRDLIGTGSWISPAMAAWWWRRTAVARVLGQRPARAVGAAP